MSKVLLFLLLVTSVAHGKSKEDPAKAKMEQLFSKHLVQSEEKIIGLTEFKKISPQGDLAIFVDKLKRVVDHKDKRELNSLYNDAPECGLITPRLKKITKNEKKEFCLKKLFRDKQFWVKMKNYLSHGIGLTLDEWSFPPQLKVDKYYDRLSEFSSTTLPIYWDYHNIYQFQLANKPLTIYKNPDLKSEAKTLPANYFFWLGTKENCRDSGSKKCDLWYPIESRSGLKGYVNFTQDKVEPLDSMAGIWIAKNDGGYYIKSIRLESPCSSHCKPEYGQ